MQRQVMLLVFRSSWRIVCTAQLCLLFSTVGITELIVKPNNTAVVEGTVAVMRCSTSERNKRVLWKFLNSSSGLLQTIFTGNRVYSYLTDLYEANNTTESQHDLLVKANTATARYYVCEEPGGKSAGADLIVFESTPKCEAFGIDSLTNGSLNRSLKVKCVIRFAGNWAPEMNWTMIQGIDGKQQIIDIDENNTYAERLLISSAMITAEPKYNGFGLEFRATFTLNHRSINRTHFVTADDYGTAADNIPEYLFVWNSSKLIVSEDSDGFFFIFGEDVFEPTPDGLPVAIIVVIVVISIFVIILSIFILRRRSKDCTSRLRRIRNDAIPENIYTATDVGPEAISPRSLNTPDIVDQSLLRPYQTNVQMSVADSSSSANYLHMTRVDLNAHPQERSPGRQHFNYDAPTVYEMMNAPMRQESSGPTCPPTPSRNKPYENHVPDARLQNSRVPSSTQNSPGSGKNDNVEYTELSNHPNADASQSSFRVSMFKKVQEYASIDHTVRVPPPPTPASAPSPPPSSSPSPSSSPPPIV